MTGDNYSDGLVASIENAWVLLVTLNLRCLAFTPKKKIIFVQRCAEVPDGARADVDARSVAVQGCLGSTQAYMLAAFRAPTTAMLPTGHDLSYLRYEPLMML